MPMETIQTKDFPLKQFKKLQNYLQNANLDMRTLFKSDPNRADKYTLSINQGPVDIAYDYSKNIFNEEVLEILLELLSLSSSEESQNNGNGRNTNFSQWRESMFKGAHINNTENRSVLHVALRTNNPIMLDGKDIVEEDVKKEIANMRRIQEQIWSKEWKGFTGKPITDIVNIGIGGSDLGPVMAVEALKAYSNRNLKFHFVSNIDGTHLQEVLDVISPETTLFIIVSKTFTTLETMTNANSAKEWFQSHAKDFKHVSSHFVAVSTNSEEVKKFGINSDTDMIKFWDWVGGRYSLWSGVGLAIMLSIGYEKFMELLNGARIVDDHFLSAPLKENIPVLMALIGILYNNGFECETQAILPYEQYLHRFPAYLQQAEMESNGKYVDRDGKDSLPYQTSPIIWGEPGTNGQHAFFQLLHQGTKLIPCDFLIGKKAVRPLGQHHEMLLANCIAQTEALLHGKTRDKLVMEGVRDPLLLSHKSFPGNRPSSTIIYDKLTPSNLGALIALYEHKIFVQGYIWRINSYDQWGVELGKQLANIIFKEIKEKKVTNHSDSSTINLIQSVIGTGKA